MREDCTPEGYRLVSAFGFEWKPAAVNSTQEFDYLYEGHRQLTNLRSFWIYGTTNETQHTAINASDYFLDDSGMCKFQKQQSIAFLFIQWQGRIQNLPWVADFKGLRQPIIRPNFPENCTKMKKIQQGRIQNFTI